MQNFGVTNKELYGMLWYFLEWSIVYSIHYSTKKAVQVQKVSQLSLASTVSKVLNEYEERGLRMVDLGCMVK